jgi:hypothetical protein
VAVVVAAYFAMLAAELRGERVNKAAQVRNLAPLLPARPRGSIERKMQNISAVLDEDQMAWIDGYKPLSHYQAILREEVHAALARDHRVGEVLAEYSLNVLPAAMPTPLSRPDVLVPPPSIGVRQRSGQISITAGPDGAVRDFQNRRLGRAGEEFVIGVEREYLAKAGRRDLADKVQWVSVEVGDGAGYDVGSFEPDGTPLAIEVKTTNLSDRTPFYVTRWEVEVSKRSRDPYALYRVFDFRSQPRLYRLDGSIEASARLEPAVLVGLPR